MCQDVVNVRRMEEAGAAAVLKAMMAGAKVAMMTSALLKRGIGYLDTIATELLLWMGEHEYSSIKQMQGSMSRNSVPQPAALCCACAGLLPRIGAAISFRPIPVAGPRRPARASPGRP
jgi:hypothetical protein